MPRTGNAPRAGLSRRGQAFGLLGPYAFLVLVACFSAVGVVALADAAREHDGVSRRIDPVTAADVLRMRTPLLTDLAHAFTFVGSEVVVGILALVILGILLVRRDLDRAAVFAIGMAGSAFLTVAVKLLVARSRPGGVDRLGAVDHSFSFPSGHTLNTTVFLALVGWLIWPSVSTLGRVALVTGAGVLSIAVAASRVYLGYHWLTDVIASGLVALAWLSIVWLLGSALPRATSGAVARRLSRSGGAHVAGAGMPRGRAARRG